MLTPAPVTPPPNPIAAVTHADPYPYYRALAARGPIQFDDGLGLWVVTGYDAIRETLHDPVARTRPLDEPIPAGLIGTATGDVFGQLVRMTDGERSRTVKAALEWALMGVPAERSRLVADRIACRIFEEGAASGTSDWPTTALFDMPVSVTGALLGLPDAALDDLGRHVRAFAAAIAPAPFTGPPGAGERATRVVPALVVTLVDQSSDQDGGLLGAFIRLSQPLGRDGRDLVIANAIGLLYQSLDATAGLIGNSLRAIARHPQLRSAIDADPSHRPAVLAETLRHDPPVQNTRRFISGPTTIAGQRLGPGDRLLLILAAGNRDPAIFPDPDRFDAERTGATPLTFGIGPHRCPGQRLAWEIALVGVREGLRYGLGRGRQPRRSDSFPLPTPGFRCCPRPEGRPVRRSMVRLTGQSHDTGADPVIAVIFEIEPADGQRDRYLDIAAELRPQLDGIDGFLSIERFESLSRPGHLLSLSFWQDDASVACWRQLETHRQAQIAGRARILHDYRLRVAEVRRDYGMSERGEAPPDSRQEHG